MLNPRLASRYAKSLLDLAIEKNQLEQVFEDIQLMEKICKGSRDFVNLLRSPIIKGGTKRKIIDAVTTGKISQLTSSFMALLTSKGREANLPEIIHSFIRQYKEHKNIHTVKLTTAVPLSDELKKFIVEKVKKSGGYETIELDEKVDNSLVGGFILQVDDKLIEASIAYDLKKISRQFENNDFIYKVR